MKVGNDISTHRAGWNFGGEVPDNFVEHAQRSIPGYHEGHDLVCQLSDHFVHEDSVCYDLGTSTGQLIRKLADHNSQKSHCRWIGIDNEESMVKAARKHCANVSNIEIYCDDIRNFAYEKSDFIVASYVMQFVRPRIRQEMFDIVYNNLHWGGAFILFEKIRGADARFQDILNSLYTDFKLRNGFTAEEIINKAVSLKSVLEPFSTRGNLDLLKRAGFIDIMTIQKVLCFEGFLAIK